MNADDFYWTVQWILWIVVAVAVYMDMTKEYPHV